MFDAVDEVGRVAAAEGIDCGYAKSGFLTVALNEADCERVRSLLAESARRGFSEADFRWLDARECDERIRIEGTRGGFYSPHGAAVQPAKLARGLARAAERRGVALYERSPARSLAPGEVVTDHGRLTARAVLVCTEGYTQRLAGLGRRLLPLHSMMIATEPLSEAQSKQIGGQDRVLFGDVRRILSYAQRTSDGRVALGAGGLYLYGSAVRSHFAPAGPEYELAERVLSEFFPALRGVEITHRWGGAMGIPRDFKPFVRFDTQSGMGAAGGYVGNGVAASNLAGRTLADLVSGRATQRTTYPWVQHRSPRWEPEPLRWLAVTASLRMGAAADRREMSGGSGGLRAALFGSLSGH
jgi:glycine/D-amino acid oxidase-like deaminating enzyme